MATTTVNTGERYRGAATRYTAYFIETNVSGALAAYDSVPAPGAGKRLVIMSMSLSANTTMIAYFRSNTTDVGGRPCSVNAPIMADGGSHGLFECAEDEKFVIALNANGTLAGWVTYIIEDV